MHFRWPFKQLPVLGVLLFLWCTGMAQNDTCETTGNCIFPAPAFSPNGDGMNDFWLIQEIENYPDNEVFVYDRWGQRVFYQKNYDNTSNYWDGGGVYGKVPAATYYYVIYDHQRTILKKGSVGIGR